MSAFVWLGTIVTRVGRTRGACAWVFAALAFAVSGAAFAQTNSIDSLTVSKGASGRTIVRFTLKNAPTNPPAGFAIATESSCRASSASVTFWATRRGTPASAAVCSSARRKLPMTL